MGEKAGHDCGQEHCKDDLGGTVKWLASPSIFYALAIAAFAVLAFNQIEISSLKASSATAGLLLASTAPRAPAQEVAATVTASQQPAASSSSGGAPKGTAVNLEAITRKVIPTGVPAVYGAELGVSFSDPVASMGKLAALDDGEGMADPAQNARYVKIGKSIACEYCCGANALVFDSGKAACGCAHSYAMRGLAKYLISKHGPELSDEQILEEVSKWKAMFFPKPMLEKAVQFNLAGKDLNVADLASNKFRGFTASSASAAPGGLDSVPSQLGGC